MESFDAIIIGSGAGGAPVAWELVQAGKTVLVLDTASADAERLYERMGWQRVGAIPDYALLPQGGLCATHYFYKQL